MKQCELYPRKFLLHIEHLLIVQPETPQRNDIAEANLYVILHYVGILQSFNLLFNFLTSPIKY